MGPKKLPYTMIASAPIGVDPRTIFGVGITNTVSGYDNGTGSGTAVARKANQNAEVTCPL